MSQCVPSWDLEDPPNTSPRLLPSSSPPHPQLLLPMADYDEVVELTWENGHLSAHSLVKPVARYSASTAGTLESVVDQANMLRQPSTGNTGPVSAEAVDALVATRRSRQCDDLASGIECDGRKRARVSPGSGGGSRDSITAGCGTTDNDFGFGVSRLPDTENTSFGSGGVGGGGGSKATMDDHYSACHSRRSLSQVPITLTVILKLFSSITNGELTWENDHLSAHGLVKPVARYSASTAGTLESIVDQANMLRQPSTDNTDPVSAAAVEALVPTRHSLQRDDLASGIECDRRKRARVSPGSGGGSRDSITVGCGTTDNDFGFRVSRLPDTENTSFGSGGVGGGGGSKATMDDHYSTCHSRQSLSQMEAAGEEDEKVTDGGTMRSTISTKRTRAAAVHNQSERKRRDKINQRIRTLQKLVPNSSKTDKASMLDEVIEYLKQLQAQVQMISRMSSIPTLPMTMPMGMQQFQMTMMAQMAQIAQMVKMGMGMGFMPDIGHMAATPSSLVRPHFGPVAAAAVPSVLQPQFLPVVGGGSSWDHPLVAEKKQQSNDAAVVMHDSFPTFVACPTQQPMTLDAYHRMAAVYQQMFQQNQASNPK